MLGTSGFDRQPLDQYFTPAWCTEALLSKVRFRGTLWEPAAGRGDMAAVLEAAGYTVIASDIAGSALGCADAAVIDFLTTGRLPDGVLSIVTNPPSEDAERFIRHALHLTQASQGMVAMLARNEYDCAAGRNDLFNGPPFARKIVLTRRPKWSDSNIASPRHNFAWLTWDWQYTGPATITWAP